MTGRAMAGLVGTSAGVSVGSLALAQVVSQPGLGYALFVLFLIGLFTLLAAAVIVSDQWVQGVWASPERWPAWIQRRRFVRLLLRAVRAVLRTVRTVLRTVRTGIVSTGRAVRATIGGAVRATIGGAVRLRRELTRDALRRTAHTVLDALGLPLDEQYEVSDVRATVFEHALTPPRSIARHSRAGAAASAAPDADEDPDLHTYLPAAYRVTRDALERASRGAKERNAALGTPDGATAKKKAAPVPGRVSTTVRVVAHHPKTDRPQPDLGQLQPDPGQLQRAFSTKRRRVAREAIKNAGHSALVAAIGILPDRGRSTAAR